MNHFFTNLYKIFTNLMIRQFAHYMISIASPYGPKRYSSFRASS